MNEYDAGNALPGASEGHRVNWSNPSLADQSTAGVTKHLVVFALLTAGALLDAGLMRSPIMTVLRDSPLLATVVAFGVAVASAVGAGWAGYAWADARGNFPGRTSRLVAPVLVMLVWVAMGAAICWLRLAAADSPTQARYDGANGGLTAVSGGAVAAVVFATVYALVGVLAFADLNYMRNDAFTAKLAAERDLARHRTSRARAEAEVRRLVENCAIRRTNVEGLAYHERLALEANHVLAGELKQLSRWEQALGFGDVNKTGITSADHEMNPASAATRTRQVDVWK